MDTGERAAYFELSRSQMRTQLRRDGTNIAKWGFHVLRQLRLQEVRRDKNSTLHNRCGKVPGQILKRIGQIRLEDCKGSTSPNPNLFRPSGQEDQRITVSVLRFVTQEWRARRVPGFHRDRAYRHGFDHALAQTGSSPVGDSSVSRTGRFRTLRPR